MSGSALPYGAAPPKGNEGAGIYASEAALETDLKSLGFVIAFLLHPGCHLPRP
jgi:hypothetical protein